LLAVAMVLTVAAPVMAGDVPDTADTVVTISAGSGNPPIIKAKWEVDTPVDVTNDGIAEPNSTWTGPTDLANAQLVGAVPIYGTNPILESGDPTHATPGSQFNAPGYYQGKFPITYYAVVTDPNGGLDSIQVQCTINHPNTQPECGSEKYQGLMTRLNKADSIAALDALGTVPPAPRTWLENTGIVKYNGSYTFDDCVYEVQQDQALVWRITFLMDYHQPAGAYKVSVLAIDGQGNFSTTLENCFDYLPLCSVEIDFSKLSYGSVSLNQHQVVGGDAVFSTPDIIAGNDIPSVVTTTGDATIRNIGNVWANVFVTQDDMGFGHFSTGTGLAYWKVNYDVRMGDEATMAEYYPGAKTLIPYTELGVPKDYLPLCHTVKLDFSILIKTATSLAPYTGQMTITAEPNFPFPPCSPTPGE